MPWSMLYGAGEPPTRMTRGGRSAASRLRPSSCASHTTTSSALAAKQPSSTASRSARMCSRAAAAAGPSRFVSRSDTTPVMPSRSMAMNSFTGPPGTWRRAASDAWHERLGRAGLAHPPREGGDQARRGLQVVAVRDLERRVHVTDREAQRERRSDAGGHELVGVGGHRLGSGLELHRDALRGGHFASDRQEALVAAGAAAKHRAGAELDLADAKKLAGGRRVAAEVDVDDDHHGRREALRLRLGAHERGLFVHGGDAG